MGDHILDLIWCSRFAVRFFSFSLCSWVLPCLTIFVLLVAFLKELVFYTFHNEIINFYSIELYTR